MKNEKIWSHLMHLGYNFWQDPVEKDGIKARATGPNAHNATDYLLCQKDVWKKTTDALKDTGCNTIIIDIGEGVIYDKYPELAVRGSWTKQELGDEVSRLKAMGFDVVPKLNFSAGHNIWMGKFARMVSTPEYYKFCDDIIDEMCELFQNPKYLHIGMDEECFSIQERSNLCIIRHGDLYWHDIFKLVKRCEKNGARPWMWADYIWHSEESKQSFKDNMTKDILCSNWYYGDFQEKNWLERVYTAYKELEDLGFDQVLAGGTYRCDDNFNLTVKHGLDNILPEHLKGFMMTTWLSTTKENEKQLLDSAKKIKEAYNKYDELKAK